MKKNLLAPLLLFTILTTPLFLQAANYEPQEYFEPTDSNEGFFTKLKRKASKVADDVMEFVGNHKKAFIAAGIATAAVAGGTTALILTNKKNSSTDNNTTSTTPTNPITPTPTNPTPTNPITPTPTNPTPNNPVKISNTMTEEQLKALTQLQTSSLSLNFLLSLNLNQIKCINFRFTALNPVMIELIKNISSFSLEKIRVLTYIQMAAFGSLQFLPDQLAAMTQDQKDVMNAQVKEFNSSVHN